MGTLYKAMQYNKTTAFQSRARTVSSKPSRSIVYATLDRQFMTGIAAGLASLTIISSSHALVPVDLKDDRKAKSTGFELIYEARDLALPQMFVMDSLRPVVLLTTRKSVWQS